MTVKEAAENRNIPAAYIGNADIKLSTGD